MSDVYLTEAQAQQLLQTSRTTLWRLRRTEGLPHYRVGGEIRYREAELRAWIQKHRPRRSRAHRYALDAPRRGREERWKEQLESGDWAFHQSPTDELTHALHPYPAKFPPPLAARLIEVLTAPGQLILDPFCGSGTTLVEAKRRGRASIGTDTNPVGILAAQAKTAVLTDGEIALLGEFQSAISIDAAREAGDAPLLQATGNACEPAPPPAIPNYERWFGPVATRELGIIVRRIEGLADPTARLVARATLSAILVSVSNQDSETRYSSRPRSIMPGGVLSRFHKKLAEVLGMLARWREAASGAECKAVLADARKITRKIVGPVDAVVTSPPYANSFDYFLYHRHRMFWLGYDPRQVQALEIGSHLKYQREVNGIESYRQDMNASLRALTTCVKRGAPCAFVVGDALFHGELVDCTKLIIDEARSVGFRCLAIVERPIHPVKRSMIAPARRARTERILLLVR